jgi:hypothetical protein
MTDQKYIVLKFRPSEDRDGDRRQESFEGVELDTLEQVIQEIAEFDASVDDNIIVPEDFGFYSDSEPTVLVFQGTMVDSSLFLEQARWLGQRLRDERKAKEEERRAQDRARREAESKSWEAARNRELFNRLQAARDRGEF